MTCDCDVCVLLAREIELEIAQSHPPPPPEPEEVCVLMWLIEKTSVTESAKLEGIIGKKVYQNPVWHNWRWGSIKGWSVAGKDDNSVISVIGEIVALTDTDIVGLSAENHGLIPETPFTDVAVLVRLYDPNYDVTRRSMWPTQP